MDYRNKIKVFEKKQSTPLNLIVLKTIIQNVALFNQNINKDLTLF